MFLLPSADLQQQLSNHGHLDWSGEDYNTGGPPPAAALISPSNTQQQNQQQQQEHDSPSSQPPPATDQNTVTASAQAATLALREKKREEIRQQKRDEEVLHLLTLLLQCVEAVAADNFEEANKMLSEISELSTQYGTSAQRVAAYFLKAMSARLMSTCLGIYSTLPPNVTVSQGLKKMTSAFQVFNGINPFVKFSHFTANQAIQEAFEREDKVHIIDLDIMQGLQWHGLFHILASRLGGPPFVRLTGSEAIHYYSKLFDSLGSSYGEESEERHVVEQQLLSKEIRNVLAIGGPSRSGEVKFNNLREKLEQSGFKGISLAGNAAAQAKLLLGMFPSNGYTLVEDKGTLKPGWQDLCLLTASARRP
ncbi:hypothetical protein L1987_37878 [Smallanthus sonchifolius]|uniref:Uncharacterized protein n=1 Tax=Smallanthus sonchifolius TaxID=185202 RepID=A0ACB9HHL1_9ASTR|nr:hypothetical protein L1987_37878 [Smallanthus sonchifolius]